MPHCTSAAKKAAAKAPPKTPAVARKTVVAPTSVRPERTVDRKRAVQRNHELVEKLLDSSSDEDSSPLAVPSRKL
jgi:hypothetical protein